MNENKSSVQYNSRNLPLPISYDCNGNITRLLRRGLVDTMHGGFGLVDNLYMTYDGNLLSSVRDNASRMAYAGATDFDGISGQEYPLTYNNAGSLTSDAGRRIARIDYDCLNNPVRIQFTDGNVTRYIYSATGEKLRVIYQTAVPNITVAIGNTRELMPSEILYTDSTDYLLGGSLTLRNGKIDKYLFDEGYCQAESLNATQDNFMFYYYDRDHLGNVRQVTKAAGSTGTVVQTMNYYPFGAQFCDGSAASGDMQPYKYNGKELDKMHGLNTYDYGARQYYSILGRWDRPDPLAEKYYGVSPYMYCLGNPVNAIDPDGNVVIPVHGTWSSPDTWKDLDGIKSATNNLFGDNTLGKPFKWSGGNYTVMRTEAAKKLIDDVRQELQGKDISEPITLVGHSHGGNVCIEAINMMMDMDEFKGRTFNLLTINTPVRDDYQLSENAQKRVSHVNVYDPNDPVQICGGNSIRVLPYKPSSKMFTGEYGSAGRIYKNPKVKNIKVDNSQGLLRRNQTMCLIPGCYYQNPVEFNDFNNFHNSHNRVQDWIKNTR